MTIGILEFGGTLNRDDLAQYFSALKLPVPDVTSVSVDGGTPRPDPDYDSQVMMDVEIIGALALSARLRLYFGSFDNRGFARAIARATADDVAIISSGWGKTEASWPADDIKAIDAALETAALKGIAVLTPAGDGGAADTMKDGRRHVSFPASSPWVLAVGGTALKSKDGKIVSEVVWKSDDFEASTGGGFSEKFPRPVWQTANPVQSIAGDGSGRGIPDVVASADPGLGTLLVVHGKSFPVGGTGPAMDVWTGLIARLDQALGYSIGYLNPRLYRDIGPAGLLRPITTGDNGVGGVTGYSAGNGWTPVAGWGSPNGSKLLQWFRDHPDKQASPLFGTRSCQAAAK